MTIGFASQVQIHIDVKSEWSVGCHWGTLRQKAHEHIMEPPTALEAELKRLAIDHRSFQVGRSMHCNYQSFRFYRILVFVFVHLALKILNGPKLMLRNTLGAYFGEAKPASLKNICMRPCAVDSNLFYG